MSSEGLPPELEMALVSLEKAEQDLVVVKKWATDPDIADEIIGFHIQQAIEKSLKAVLLSRSTAYPRTHNLRLLVDLCQNANLQVPAEFLEVDIFNRFAVEWRYDLLPSSSQMALDRDDACKIATHVLAWAKVVVNQPR